MSIAAEEFSCLIILQLFEKTAAYKVSSHQLSSIQILTAQVNKLGGQGATLKGLFAVRKLFSFSAI